MSVHIFVDNSNIWISAQRTCEIIEPYVDAAATRLYLPNLKFLASAGRRDAIFHVYTSFNPHSDPWYWYPEPGENIYCETFERGACSNSEQAVDEAIQLAMYRVMLAEKEPGTVVLLTGDGKGFEEGKGFVQTLYDMHKNGWGVEVLSWETSCHHELRDFAEKNGVFVSLDDYYQEVTFAKGFRFAKQLSLRRRKMAEPDVSKDAWLRIRHLQRENQEWQKKFQETQEELQKIQARVVPVQTKKAKGKKRYDKIQKNRAKEMPQVPTICSKAPSRLPYETFSELMFA